MPDITDELDGAAREIQRLATLLRAGVAPRGAWGHLAGSSGSTVVASVDREARTARDVGGAIARATTVDVDPHWRQLAAAWDIAVESGSPLAHTLETMSRTVRARAELRREVEVAVAGPAATSRVVLTMPPVSLLFGTLLGFDTLSVLFGSPLGWVCLGLGAALLVIAARWNRTILTRARRLPADGGIALELGAIALAGGASVPLARARVMRAMRHYLVENREDELDRIDGAARAEDTPLPGVEALDTVLDFSQRAGVAASALLRGEASDARRELRARTRREIAGVPARQMLPLGLCVLPAFLAVGVVPVVIALVSSTALLG